MVIKACLSSLSILSAREAALDVSAINPRIGKPGSSEVRLYCMESTPMLSQLPCRRTGYDYLVPAAHRQRRVSSPARAMASLSRL